MNAGVFRIFLPLLLFENMYTSHMHILDAGVLIYAVCSVLLIFALCWLALFKWISDNSRAATMVQGMYRSNFALLGIALTQTMYGSDEVEITGMLVAGIIPLYNVLAVILFETKCQGKKSNLGGVVTGIVKNPLIIGTAVGLVLNLTHIKLPVVIESACISMGQVATPLALVVMGGSFKAKTAVANKNDLIFVSAVRLIVIPVLFTAAAILFGYRGKQLYGLFVMYATPTAVASYAMASAMGGNEELAGEIVLVTTMISMVTLGIGVYLLSGLSFI